LFTTLDHLTTGDHFTEILLLMLPLHAQQLMYKRKANKQLGVMGICTCELAEMFGKLSLKKSFFGVIVKESIFQHVRGSSKESVCCPTVCGSPQYIVAMRTTNEHEHVYLLRTYNYANYV
jgi:hypothetical protein